MCFSFRLQLLDRNELTRDKRERIRSLDDKLQMFRLV